MQMNGVLEISVPPAQVLQHLAEPAVLSALLPGKGEVTQTAPGRYDFTLMKKVGFLEIRQSGQIHLTQPAADRALLALTASHLIGGSVAMEVTVNLTERPKGTRIHYDGTVSAKGLAGRLLRDREQGVQPYVNRVFARLKAQIEAAPSAGV
jgi:carbon monoxide dehydrogenase subunit G